MIIRPLQNNEIIQAVQLRSDCWDDDFGAFIPRGYFNVPEEEKNITEWINEQGTGDIRRMYGAFEGDTFLGYAGACLADKGDAKNGVELTFLFIKKPYRSMGIGRELMLRIAVEYKGYGFDEMIVYNWKESISNQFYRRLGARPIRDTSHTVKGKVIPADVFSIDLDRLIVVLKGNV